ncbi:hypothetical protein PC129_g2530 [Phytophthora cactorum]|uniref:Uncharacterized protein n=1 Tax=Phytophthora cactorum TaxID=29920 RepID=A0A8T1LVA4_9STRA|nr:hypothetical protein PC114_g771 [Phytophthora cactorum]KAG2955942.1 hypothetical protein PC117_g38 [Phytophthora cactorum]KAG3036340.1 hypothetical protein PC120_g298 [Phytophthora cactorum]KAG3042252.1 hypothetical protein PC119_g263 [Phytophthora cactorum]KAG3192845.1 hypothetical protein C6341_g393 [Phytophthora cactorum]
MCTPGVACDFEKPFSERSYARQHREDLALALRTCIGK